MVIIPSHFETVFFLFKLLKKMPLKLYYIILFLLNISFILRAEDLPSKELYFDKLTIYGKSNVNDFSFVFENNSEALHTEKVLTKKTNQKTEYLFPVKRFKTDNKCIQNDFLNMIQADRFPNIVFSIDNEQIELLASDNICDSINAMISIAQESKQIWIPIKKDEQIKGVFVTGKIDLLLTDFNLTPLSKFFGLVKVENNVIIDFKINLAR
jgi:hypothetical protein